LLSVLIVVQNWSWVR